MGNTTIQIDGETTKEDLDDIKEDEGHSSMDSTVKALVRDHERVPELEEDIDRLEDELAARPDYPFSDAVAEAYQRFEFETAQPLPEAVGESMYGSYAGSPKRAEDIPRLFRLFIKGPWIANAQFAAQSPEYVDVIFTDGGFLFRHQGGFMQGGKLAHFFVAREDYEDELLNLLTANDIEPLAPPGGIRTTTKEWTNEYECVNVEWGGSEWWAVMGGYGREVEDGELNALLNLRTVDEAIREEGELAFQQDQIQKREHDRKSAAVAAGDDNRSGLVRSGLHIDPPAKTIKFFWQQFAQRRIDWEPYDDIELDDLLPEDPRTEANLDG